MTPLRASLGLDEHDIVVGYAGNLGPAQRLDALLDAAALLSDRDDVHFLICGTGSDATRVGERAASLTNVSFVGLLPFESMPEVYATMDVSVVSLAKGLSGEVLPSKVWRSMACARTILAVSDEDSTLASLVRTEQCGATVVPDGLAVADAIRDLAAADRVGLGRAARQAAERNADRVAVTAHIASLLEDAARAGRQ